MSVSTFDINSNIFPRITTIDIGDKIPKDNDTRVIQCPSSAIQSSSLRIDLPRGANLLYLKSLSTRHAADELHLLEKYACGINFTDAEYKTILGFIMTSHAKYPAHPTSNDPFAPYGVCVSKNSSGALAFSLIENSIPAIKAETWECIIIDHLKPTALDIISCFDFASTFNRKMSNNSHSAELRYNLNAWKFSFDLAEQSLSTTLRFAFMFTLVSYCYGDVQSQYPNFSSFFEAEFFKRVSLVYGIWNNRGSADTIEYIPLYDSFYNLSSTTKSHLITVLRAILDDSHIALDEKEVLRSRLIEGAGTFHHNVSEADQELENSLIKPTINFIVLREKAKESLTSAQILLDEGKYMDCANRCYYAMMHSLKMLLEYKGKLANWKPNELKERETHDSLEAGLDDLISDNVLTASDKSSFDFVKSQRWKCDYSLYVFKRPDAENCVSKALAFYTKINAITI